MQIAVFSLYSRDIYCEYRLKNRIWIQFNYVLRAEKALSRIHLIFR
jgi:hypothetical protein